MPVSCLIADDHDILRYGIRRALGIDPEFKVVGEACDANELEQLTFEHHPDLVLCDIGMPGQPVWDTARRIRKEFPRIKFVFLTMYQDESYLAKALDMKAAGYVLKNTPPEVLVKGLRQCMKGNTFISPPMVYMVESLGASRPVNINPLSLITIRERETIKFLVEGHSVKEIAILMGISCKTVEAHKFNTMQKLNMHSKVEMVNFAIRNKLITCPCHQASLEPLEAMETAV